MCRSIAFTMTLFAFQYRTSLGYNASFFGDFQIPRNQLKIPQNKLKIPRNQFEIENPPKSADNRNPWLCELAGYSTEVEIPSAQTEYLSIIMTIQMKMLTI